MASRSTLVKYPNVSLSQPEMRRDGFSVTPEMADWDFRHDATGKQLEDAQ